MTRVAIIGAGPSGTAQLRAFASAQEKGARRASVRDGTAACEIGFKQRARIAHQVLVAHGLAECGGVEYALRFRFVTRSGFVAGA